MGFCPQLGGVGPCPAQCIWQGSGFAADQTNAMLAVGGTSCISLVSVAAADENSLTPLHRRLPTEIASLGFDGNPIRGGDKSSRKRKSLRLLGTASSAEEFPIYSRETRCFFIWASRDFSPCTQCYFGISAWGVVSLPLACASCRRNAGRAGGGRWLNSSLPSTLSPSALRAHTAAYMGKHGGVSPSL